MSDRWQSCEERILELLADQAAFGLSADEQEELSALLVMMPDFDQDCMQRMAATVHLASVGGAEPLPASLQRESELATDRGFPQRETFSDLRYGRHYRRRQGISRLNVRVSHEPE